MSDQPKINDHDYCDPRFVLAEKPRATKVAPGVWSVEAAYRLVESAEALRVIEGEGKG